MSPEIERSSADIKKEAYALVTRVGIKEYATKKGKTIPELKTEDYQKILDYEANKPTPLTLAEISVATATHNKTKVMCIVTDHDNTTNPEESIPNQVWRGSWGNKTGTHSVQVALHGLPQYLHVGTISLLESVMMTNLNKDQSGKNRAVLGTPRFKVTRVEGFSQEQLEALSKKQKLRG